MARVLLLFTILVSIGSSFQQLQSLQSSQAVSLGGTIVISCRWSGGTIVDGNNYPVWLQQKQRSVPRLMIYYTSRRPSEVPARFSGSKSGNTMSLTITGAMTEDESDYYCALWAGSAWVFGGGTTLTISGQPTVAPKVHLFPPSKEELESKSKATLVCLLQEFSPAAFQVTWVADGTDISNGVETTKATKVNDKYVASSYLTVSASDWKSHESFSCKVTHEGSHFMKSVSHSQCP